MSYKLNITVEVPKTDICPINTVKKFLTINQNIKAILLKLDEENNSLFIDHPHDPDAVYDAVVTLSKMYPLIPIKFKFEFGGVGYYHYYYITLKDSLTIEHIEKYYQPHFDSIEEIVTEPDGVKKTTVYYNVFFEGTKIRRKKTYYSDEKLSPKQTPHADSTDIFADVFSSDVRAITKLKEKLSTIPDIDNGNNDDDGYKAILKKSIHVSKDGHFLKAEGYAIILFEDWAEECKKLYPDVEICLNAQYIWDIF